LLALAGFALARVRANIAVELSGEELDAQKLRNAELEERVAGLEKSLAAVFAEKETASAEASEAKDLFALVEQGKESKSRAFSERRFLAKYFIAYKTAIGRKVYEENIQWAPEWERKLDWIGMTCAFRRWKLWKGHKQMREKMEAIEDAAVAEKRQAEESIEEEYSKPTRNRYMSLCLTHL